MKTSTTLATLAISGLAVAQTAVGPNAINIPAGGLGFTTGQTLTLTLTNLQGSRINVLLETGASTDLRPVSTLTASAANTGVVTVVIPTNIPKGNYALAIINAENPSVINYSPQINVDSSFSGPVAVISSASPSVTTSLTTATSTNTKSGSSTTVTSVSTSTITSSQTTLSSAVAVNGTISSSSSSSGTGTSSTTVTGTTTKSVTGSTTGSALATGTGAASRMNAAAGMVGALVLGAFAL